MLNYILCIIDAAICIAIALRIIFFCKRGSQYKRCISWLAATMAVFYGNFPLLWFYNHYVLREWPVMITNIITCVLIYRTRGNVAHLLRRAD
ncbi:hypothetical protein COO59_00705 [Mixta theicola]|uniref:Phage holin family protein n=1 Tax=Mixta theicola TaxID=1458355 RepID=A0A2K1QEB7_9GAMM|nr:phage holin family protein [Mixta theicola]PNS13370.1 hypothetical protein COO59_00705 [Mixta theicola]